MRAIPTLQTTTKFSAGRYETSLLWCVENIHFSEEQAICTMASCDYYNQDPLRSSFHIGTGTGPDYEMPSIFSREKGGGGIPENL